MPNRGYLEGFFINLSSVFNPFLDKSKKLEGGKLFYKEIDFK